MGKLKLNLDDLKVESFVTTPGQHPGRGTVFAQDLTQEETFCWTCQNCLTEGDTCGCTAVGCQTNEYTCNHGLTYTCSTDPNGDCAPLSWGPDTCQGSCTDNGCTACDQAC